MSKREVIISAAIKEFGKNSYDAASVNKIIKASGTSKGTFYHYFKNKEDLYLNIINHIAEIKQNYFTAMTSDIKNKNCGFFETMKNYAKTGTQFMLDNTEIYNFGTMFINEQGKIKELFKEKLSPDIESSFKKIVAAGIAGGCFSNRFPAEFIDKIICHIMINYYDILFDKEESPAPEEISRRLDMLFDFLQKGLS